MANWICPTHPSVNIEDCPYCIIQKLNARISELEQELNIFLNAKCPGCGFEGKLVRMKPKEGCVAEPGEYWCSACNSTLNVVHLQFVNEKLVEKMERLERERDEAREEAHGFRLQYYSLKENFTGTLKNGVMLDTQLTEAHDLLREWYGLHQKEPKPCPLTIRTAAHLNPRPAKSCPMITGPNADEGKE